MHVWRPRTAFALCTALAMSAVGTHADAAVRRFPHVRVIDSASGALLARGYNRSSTFRDLVDTIESSDLIVHVERRALTSGTASLHFVTRAGGYRYLRIVLDDGEVADGTVALLGHELQHAVEVAGAAWVVDLSTFLQLYRDIGHVSCEQPRHCFDTVMAVNAGRQILSELRWPSRGDRVAVTHTWHRADAVRRLAGTND